MQILLLFFIVALVSCSREDEQPTPTPTLSITYISPTIGNAGTNVIIVGKNFASSVSGNTVTFNGSTATVTQAIDTQLNVIAPEGVTSGRISVTTNGQTVYSQDSFMVVTGKWTQMADFGGSGRVRATGFSIGNKGYIFTGISFPNYAHDTDFWQYDPEQNQWTQKASFPGEGRENAVSFALGNKGYITTGFKGGKYFNDLWEYDAATDQWTKKADFPGNQREWAVAFIAGSKGYVTIGYDLSNVADAGPKSFKDLWQYDPQTNVWTQKANFPGAARGGSSSFTLNDKGYVGLGDSRELWEYDTQSDLWTRKADFPASARSFTAGFSIAGKGYMGFGISGDDIHEKRDFWEYDPAKNQWTQKLSFTGSPKYSLVGFSIGDRGYIGTGYVDNFKEFWEFTPQ